MSETVSNTAQEQPSSSLIGDAHHQQASIDSPAGQPALEAADPQAQEAPLFYTQEDDFDLNRPLVDDAPFVLPFQLSSEMEPISSEHAKAGEAQRTNTAHTPTPHAHALKTRFTLRMLKVLLIASVVLVTLIGTSLLLFAQSSHSSQPSLTTVPTQGPGVQTPAHTTPTATKTTKPSATPAKTQTQPQGGTGGTVAPVGLPSMTRLAQIGWSQAGFTVGDAIEAQRTALTFTDREMSYDYRDIGTLAHHGGTLTGAEFLLTPGGQIRFNQNDVRAINNSLYDQVSANDIIQQVVNMQANFDQIGSVQEQGQVHQLVWITVSFELFQAQTNPSSGQRSEGLELDAHTGQPMQHQMQVLLLRVAPQTQDSGAPMGGTGWLVNTYARDTTDLPFVETVPSL